MTTIIIIIILADILQVVESLYSTTIGLILLRFILYVGYIY
jgi:hypothetical protein